jgi:XTP/dITP diphosphohydrolase
MFNCFADMSLKLNTSNAGKFEEFKTLFSSHGTKLETTAIDLKEIEADPLQVVVHKASQLGENILVEDTSLDIEGASVGVNVRWLLDHLSEYAGRKATWTVLLAVRKGDTVFVYRGTVAGTIVVPKGGNGFGFDPVFLPEGATKTLAEAKPDSVNARAKAVEAFVASTVWATHPVIEKWDGPWQKDDHSY